MKSEFHVMHMDSTLLLYKFQHYFYSTNYFHSVVTLKQLYPEDKLINIKASKSLVQYNSVCFVCWSKKVITNSSYAIKLIDFGVRGSTKK